MNPETYGIPAMSSTETNGEVSPLADVHGTPPETVSYEGAAASLQRVWVATRGALRSILEEVTVADIVAGTLPPTAERFLDEPDAWSRR